MWTKIFYLSAVIAVAACVDSPLYIVPQPLFEVFSPKGLRVSIPDSPDVKSTQFLLSFTRPVLQGDPGELSHEVQEKLGGHWMYWNPEVAPKLGDVIFYRVVVKHRDLYWTKEGQYVVDKVTPLQAPPDVDCDEQVPVPVAFPSTDDIVEHQLGRIGSGKKSSYKSSYSMYKNSDVKPITRSSTSTTSGTFYIKPTGVLEASGYKSISSYDSTRRDGEQWQHSESELSAAEIEELKRLHGANFMSFANFPRSYHPSSGAQRVEQNSYFEKSSHGSPSYYVESPSGAQRFEQSYFTKESSSRQAKPVILPPTGAQNAATRYEERYYTQESRRPLPRLHGSVIHSSEFERQEKTVPETPISNVEFSRKETHKVISNEGANKVYPLEDIEIGKTPQEDREFNGGNVQTVEKSSFHTTRHHTGSIFTTNRSSQPRTPEECVVIPDIDYRPTNDLREVEKSVNKLSCLASFAEASVKEELRLVKQQNAEFLRKFDRLELEVRRLSEECKCLERAH